MLNAGFYDVPKGHVATIVTQLEMRTAPAVTLDAPPDLTLVHHAAMDPETYRSLFRQIGEDYLWFSRLRMTDQDLTNILSDASYDLYTLQMDGVDLGLLELDFRTTGECELAFFGLDQKLIGKGAGKYLMAEAITRAFERDISRLHVHTCTLDSPQALGFYIKSGFNPTRQEVEIAIDPRLSGEIKKSAAPRIPLFEET